MSGKPREVAPKKVTQLSADDMRSQKETKMLKNIAKKEAKEAAAKQAVEDKKRDARMKVCDPREQWGGGGTGGELAGTN